VSASVGGAGLRARRALVAVALVVCAGCRTNQLAGYANDALKIAVVDASAPGTGPIVAVQEAPATNTQQAVTNNMDAAVVGAVQHRLAQVAAPDAVSPPITKRVADGVLAYLPKSALAEPAAADVRLEVVVARYGVTVAGSAYGWMQIGARMVDVKRGAAIWETTENVTVPLTSVPAIVSVNPGGGFLATSALAALTDDQWRAVFDELGKAAAAAVLDRIRLDAVKG
jgi:hypothetical protein